MTKAPNPTKVRFIEPRQGNLQFQSQEQLRVAPGAPCDTIIGSGGCRQEESGIEFAQNRPYAISVMTTFLHNQRDGADAIAKISVAAYNGRASEYGRMVATSNRSNAH